MKVGDLVRWQRMDMKNLTTVHHVGILLEHDYLYPNGPRFYLASRCEVLSANGFEVFHTILLEPVT